jgi:hypothetical protein
VRERGELLGLAACERNRPDLLVAQEEHSIALRCELWRGVAHVA